MPLLRLADADIYHEVHGSGPAIVFAHGLGGNHISWWQQVPHFGSRYTCLTFAHRGFAPSTDRSGAGPRAFAADLAALMDSLEIGSAVLVGQSMGGWTCTAFALEHPERVRALVLTSTTGVLTSSAIDAAWAAHPRGLEMPLFLRGIHPAAGGRMAAEQPALAFLYREIDALTGALHKQPIREVLAEMRTIPAEHLATLGFPVLCIAGDEDIVVPPAAVAALAAELPGQRLVRIPDAGHSVYFERAPTFNRVLDAFLTEIG